MVQRKEAIYCKRHKIWTPEHRAKISAAIKGRPKSVEHRRKLSIARTGDGRIDRTCELCGKPFRAYKPSARTRFCGKRCAGIWRAVHCVKNCDTDIERIFEAEMKRRSWYYRKQHPLLGITVADFYLPGTSTAIFCDGDYWHRLPQQRKRDGYQTHTLLQAGIRVCRFLGSAIHRDVVGCVDQVEHGHSPIFRPSS